jgi:hypothetical protein
MMELYTHKFTYGEAAILQAGISGIQSALDAWDRKSAKQRAKEQLRYDFDDADKELLAAMAAIRAGDEIELDSATWTWLQVQLETWMSDAPLALHGAIWHLTEIIVEMLQKHPHRSIPYRKSETETEAVVTKATQKSLF